MRPRGLAVHGPRHHLHSGSGGHRGLGILGALFGFGDFGNVLLDLEELDDTTLELLRKDYGWLARKAKSRTKAPIRAEEVPVTPEKSKSRKEKPNDD